MHVQSRIASLFYSDSDPVPRDLDMELLFLRKQDAAIRSVARYLVFTQTTVSL